MPITRSQSPRSKSPAPREAAASTPRSARKSAKKRSKSPTPSRKDSGSSASGGGGGGGGGGAGGGALGGAPPFTGAGLLICVAVAIVSFLLVARGVGEASDGFKIDKATSIQFPVEQKFDCCSTLALAGVGVRKKSGVIPIYSVGMYSSASGLSGGSAASLLARSAPKVAQLTFALITGVPAESAAAALRDGVAKVGGVDKAVLSEFKALLMSGLGSAKMKKKETMTLEWGGDGKSSVAVTVRGKYVGKIKNPSLANALLRLYLDEKYTVSKALVKNIGSGK